MKNDFREFYDVDYIMHSYTDDELMHWEWPAGVRKYIDKIRTASGKLRYIYENDIKPGVQKGINKGKQILQEDVDFYKDAIDKAKKHQQFKQYKKNTQGVKTKNPFGVTYHQEVNKKKIKTNKRGDKPWDYPMFDEDNRRSLTSGKAMADNDDLRTIRDEKFIKTKKARRKREYNKQLNRYLKNHNVAEFFN